MNIWLINHYAVPPQYYPLARQYNFARQLMRKGHSVTIFAASTVHNSDINLIQDDTPYKDDFVDGVHYVYIKCREYNGNGIKRIMNMCEFAWKLPRVCSRYKKPDAIVATSIPPMCCAAGVRLAHRYGCKGIAEIADLWPESIVAYGIAGRRNPAVVALRMLEKWIYKHADRVVFTMEGAYDYIIERKWQKILPEKKVEYINNGVDLEEFDADCDRFRVDDKDLADLNLFKVVFTGSIRHVNNLGRLLDIAKLVSNPKIKFLIWGNGDELEQLTQRVSDEHINNVEFKGVVDKKYIPYIVSNADVNILHNEPNPILRFGISLNKLFDYMAAGKPIITDFECKYSPLDRTTLLETVTDTSLQGTAKAIDRMADMADSDYKCICKEVRSMALNYDFSVLTDKLLKVIDGIDK